MHTCLSAPPVGAPLTHLPFLLLLSCRRAPAPLPRRPHSPPTRASAPQEEHHPHPAGLEAEVARAFSDPALADVDDVPGGVQATIDLTFEIEGVDKPACVAQVVYRWLY